MIINVLEYLEQVKLYAECGKSNCCALVDETEEISYSQLITMAKQVGTYIAGKSNWKNRPIAVLIDRNVWSVVLFMGIAYSGNFYVPIDPTMPQKRIELILNTLNPVMILSSVPGKGVEGRTVIDMDECLKSEIDENLLGEIRRKAIDTDPLYAIFTSGSTGVPKGVLVSHRSVIDLVEQFAETFDFPEKPVFGNQAPLDFDVSVKDIYCSLKLGGTVQIIPKKLFSVPAQLIPYLNERKVSVIIWAVSAMRIVSNYKILDIHVPEYLSLVMFSGEVMPVKSLNDWMDHLPDTTFVNLYGPTEITCNCTYYKVDRRFANEEVLPIGKAFRNTEVFLLDENGKAISKDTQNSIGEICVKGTCLALGYFNNEEKTREAFVQNPLNTVYPERIYRTGDLGFYEEDGNICFASRKDYQIKHMGHRIELGEIEVAVNALSFVDAGCCIFDEKREKIVLCYQAKEACDKQIVGELAMSLPKFMWPQKFMHFEQLPMNKNSKIDRVLLQEMCCQNNEGEK